MYVTFCQVWEISDINTRNFLFLKENTISKKMFTVRERNH